MSEPDLTRSRPSPRTIALIALVLLVPVPTIGTWMGMVVGGEAGRIAFVISKAWILLLPVTWLVLVDRRAARFPVPAARGIGVGALLGLLISALIGATYLFVGPHIIDPEIIRAKAVETRLAEPLIYLGFAVFTCVINAMLEEYVWRWFVYRKCEQAWPAINGWAAVFLSAVFFTMHHIVALGAQFGWQVTLLGSVGVFMGGVVWSALYRRYRSVWPGYISHVIIDITIFIIGWDLIFG